MLVRLGIFLLRPLIHLLDYLAPLGDLSARVWISWIFLKAGLTKIEVWQSTVILFQYEYTVPFLSPKVAALMGTGAELILPILLIIGLGGRLIIAIFFVYNLVAMISYPFLWTSEGAQGLAEHISWGLLLALLMFHGSGKWSLDHWIRLRHMGQVREEISKTTGL